MFELKCPNCGGKLTAEEDQVREFNGVVMVRSGKKLSCGSCGADFERGDELDVFGGNTTVVTGDGNIVVGNISGASGVAIGNGARVAFNKSGQKVGRQVNIGGGGGVNFGGSRNVVIHGDVTGGDSIIITGDDNTVVHRRR